MKPEDFVDDVISSVIEDGLNGYVELLEQDSLSDKADPYWKSAHGLFKNLSGDEQDILVNIMKQVSIDTVSCMFGVLDGSVVLRNGVGTYDLTLNGGNKINGDLQSILLNKICSK